MPGEKYLCHMIFHPYVLCPRDQHEQLDFYTSIQGHKPYPLHSVCVFGNMLSGATIFLKDLDNIVFNISRFPYISTISYQVLKYPI